MINKEKTILMTKLAIYDKTSGEADRKAGGFFRHDYVYWKNFWARLNALLGCLIIVSFYVLDKLVIEKTDLFDIDYKAEGVRILFLIVAVLAIVSSISSIIATREYSAIQKRIAMHLEMTKRLDYLSANAKEQTAEISVEGDLPVYHGTIADRKRSRN